MRVGLVIYGSLDITTGGFIYDRRLVRYLREQGDRVEVISLPWRAYGLSLLDNLNFGLRRLVAHAAFDLLLQDELVHSSCFWLNRRRRPRMNCPVIAIVHHLRCREGHAAWRTRLYRRVEKNYLASVDGFVCVSRTTAADVEDLAGRGRPLVVASPGRDGLPGAVTPQEIINRVTAPGPVQILFVGNLIPRKGLHTLLTALAQLPRNSWRLTVAGSLEMDATYVKAIRRQIADAGLAPDVSLLGTLDAADLAARYAASHLLAVPSTYEGFGMVYLEGRRFGLPAIASTAGAAHEIITPGHDGFLVPSGDAAALAQCLELLIRDRERLLTMSLAAMGAAAAHPTWNDSAGRVRAFLLSLLA